MRRAIEVRFEGRALLAQLAQVSQAEDLEAAAIGQDRPVPVHEGVQPAELLDQFRAGPQQQVIGIAEDDLCSRLAQLFWRNALDGGLRADGHEDGRGDNPVRRLDRASSRPAIGAFRVYAE